MKKIDRSEFNSRVSELRFYIRCLRELETLLEIDRTNEYGRFLKKKIDGLERKHKSEDLIEILKANAYMIMYNLVEDTVRRIVSYIYTSINKEHLSFSNFNDTYQKLIRKYTFNLNGNPTAQKVAKKSAKLINDILMGEDINIVSDNFKLSGNANLKSIEKVCRDHKIPITLDYVDKYKDQLDNVKNVRNELAHGRVGFVAATHNKTVDDTYRCVQDIVVFLRYLMKKAEKLVNEKNYTKD